MDAELRKKELLEHQKSPAFFDKTIDFGDKRVMAEGHRFYYENAGIVLIGKKEGLFIHGIRNGKPTIDYILVPACTKLLTSFKDALYDCYDNLSIDIAFESSPYLVENFIYHERSIGDCYESFSRGRYGSRFRGMVAVRGIRFKIYLGKGVFIQPLISKNARIFGDELQESKSYLALPANKSYFKKMAEAVEQYQTELFYNSVMEISNAK
jgi:hypothetical protein